MISKRNPVIRGVARKLENRETTDVQKHQIGRPLKYTAKELLKEGIAYFKQCEEKKEQITITGLALALGTSRKVLCEYEETDNEDIRNTVKSLKAYVEHQYEVAMWKANNPTAGIFALKNMGWTDKTDIDINAKLRPSSYSEEEEQELREFARLRALVESTKAITTGNEE
jgi:hypothetical protein